LNNATPLTFPMTLPVRLLVTGLLSVLTLSFTSGRAFAQSDNNSTLNPQFAAASREISFGCGVFLPNNVPGVTEVMDLCGGRYAFQVGQGSMLEAELFTGNGSGQSYDFGAFNYRGDMSLDDLVASFYIGPVMHYVTGHPAAGTTTPGTTSIYFGADAGTAVWFSFSSLVSLRGDLQINVNPGVELFLGMSLVFRFGSDGGGG
jgi:hypothetical protein